MEPFDSSITRLKELKATLKIDVNSLENELIYYSEIFFDIAQNFAIAKSVRDAAKNDLDELYANLAQAFRSNAATLGEKLTESKLEEMVLIDSAHIAAATYHLDASNVCEQWQALRDAFHSRGYMLRDLVSMHTVGYNNSSGVISSGEDEYTKARRERLNRKENPNT